MVLAEPGLGTHQRELVAVGGDPEDYHASYRS